MFYATDTLIHSVSVWRHHAQTPYGGSLKLWIARVDSAGSPDASNILLDGPVITVPFGDGIHPIKMEWLLEPPFALPHPGTYCFAVQDYCDGHWDLLYDKDNSYADGFLSRSGITCFSSCSALRPFASRFVDFDMIFDIEFCADTVTSVHRKSWGQLKTMYR